MLTFAVAQNVSTIFFETYFFCRQVQIVSLARNICLLLFKTNTIYVYIHYASA